MKVLIIDDKGNTEEFTNFALSALKELKDNKAVVTALICADGPATTLGILEGVNENCKQLRKRLSEVAKLREAPSEVADLMDYVAENGTGKCRVVHVGDMPKFMQEVMGKEVRPNTTHNAYRSDKQREYNRRARHHRD